MARLYAFLVDAATNDPRFLATLADLFEVQPEILVLFRYRNAAGSKEFELHSSFASLSERMLRLAAGTAVTAFRQPQLPVRGTVDDALIRTCLDVIPNGAEFLFIETVVRTAGGSAWFHHAAGESHDELRESLEDSRGRPVAAGLYPEWPGTDEDTVHAYAPDADGVIRIGAY